MSAPAWSQGGQPVMQNHGQRQPPVQRRNTNPPPVCFNCGVEGHFLVACPEASRITPGGLPPISTPYQQYPGPIPQPQPYPPQGGPVQYPTPYQQNPQYGPPGPQYSYNQPQALQPYGVPPPQYGRPGYQQPPPYNQYPPPNGPPQFNSPGYQAPPQQLGTPVTPYQQPPNPYPPQNAGYGGNYQPSPAPLQPPQPQWNPMPPAVRPPYQQPHPQRSNSILREPSGTPIHQMQKQRSQSLQRDRSIDSHRQTPQTPVSQHSHHSHHSQHGGIHQVSRRGSQVSVVVDNEEESRASSPAGTPYGRYGMGDDVTMEASNDVPASASQDELDKPEEGEVGEVDEDDALFNWEFKYIFKEPKNVETVALAQPLSASFKSTPVPLVQAWTMNVPSISRYARKDNLKDFVRPIRTSPQWSYLQEDPAFAEVELSGPVIPLDELPAWTAAHHAETDLPGDDEMENEFIDNSRKRARSDEEEESFDESRDQVDDNIHPENSSDTEGPPIKRQKNEEDEDKYGDDHDHVMRTPILAPVIVNRSGTPCVETDDDAWAPQPGESASTPLDPTEALLASLGVTGSPKPVQKEPNPSYMNDLEEQPRSQSSQPSHSTQPTPNPPQNSQPFNGPFTNNQSSTPINHQIGPTNAQKGPPMDLQIGPPMNNGPTNTQPGPPTNYPNGPPINNQAGPYINQGGHQMNNQNVPPMNHNNGPPMNTQYGGPMQGPPQELPQGPPQYGPAPNGPYGNPQYPNSSSGNFPQGNLQYGPPVDAPYQNGPPQSFGAPNQQYGPPANAAYSEPSNNYGPPNNYQQQGPPQWGPPQSASYNQGPPVNDPQGYPQYAPPHNAPYQNTQHGPVVNTPYGNTATPTSYYPQQGPPQYGPQQNQPQYGLQRNPSFGSGPPIPGPYGLPQSSPTNYGPPQNVSYGPNAYPNGPPQQQYNHGLPAPYTNGPPNDTPQPNGPPQQFYNNGPSGNVPPRQDSGYMSARGSYSKGSGHQDFSNQNGPPESAEQPPANDTPIKQETTFRQDQDTTPQKMSRKNSDTGSRATDETGTPLSPESAMILGKLEGKSSNDRAGERKRMKEASARKLKRPQPVVAEAYSRRW